MIRRPARFDQIVIDLKFLQCLNDFFTLIECCEQDAFCIFKYGACPFQELDSVHVAQFMVGQYNRNSLPVFPQLMQCLKRLLT